MLFAVAGAKLYIGDAYADDVLSSDLSVPADQDWLVLTATESIGIPGIAWETQGITADDSDAGITRTIKTNIAPQGVQVIMGLETADAGQLRLWDAAYGEDDYGFKLTFGDSQTRFWRAAVVGLREVFDTADAVVKLQADLQLNSTVTKVGV